MAKPFLRYLPAKLKPVSAPAVWIPLTIATLLSILLWEYYNNPDWFERDPITNANPESALTPDEQAKLSEIDTVDLLLKGAQVSGPLSDLETDVESPDGLAPVNPEADAAGTSRQLADQSDPFGAYAEEYKFPGSDRAGSGNQPINQNSTATGTTTPFNFGSTRPSQATAPSALSTAIDQQQAIKDQEAERSSGSTNSSSDNSTQTPGQATVPFIRTTPAMSPPVGTTGYQSPATSNLPNFNLAPPQTTQNPLNTSAPAGTILPSQIGTVQPSPIARPVQSNPAPATGTLYTAPNSTQPAQNRQAR